MDLGLKNLVAVVTGGTSGIGLATVRMLLEEGALVGFCGRSEEHLEAAKAELKIAFSANQFAGFCCDVLDANAVVIFAERIMTRFGSVDILINNAGQRRMSTFENTSDKAWHEELQLKFFSIIRPTRAFLPALELSDQAAIVCVNSLLALQPEPQLVATSAARAGVLNLARSLATEFASKGIRVNSVLLGMINSGQWRAQFTQQALKTDSFVDWLATLAKDKHIPLGRFGKPEEAAHAIVFLASAASAFTTGAVIDVSGGVNRH